MIEASGNRLGHVADGVIKTDSKLPLADRLVQLQTGLTEIIERFHPLEAAVEETFVNKNPSSTLKLGLARGIALLAPATVNLPVAEYAAKFVKKALVGTGSAEKHQVEMMVGRLLPGVVPAGPDAADALAVAICHAHHGGTTRRWQDMAVVQAGR